MSAARQPRRPSEVKPNGKQSPATAREIEVPEHARRQIIEANAAMNRAAAMREAIVSAVLAGAGVDPEARDGCAWRVVGDVEKMTAKWLPVEAPSSLQLADAIERARAAVSPAGDTKPN